MSFKQFLRSFLSDDKETKSEKSDDKKYSKATKDFKIESKEDNLAKVPNVQGLSNAINDLADYIYKEFNTKPGDPIRRIDPYIILSAVNPETNTAEIVIATNSPKYKNYVGESFNGFRVNYISLEELIKIQQSIAPAKSKKSKNPQLSMMDKGLVGNYVNAISAFKDVLIEQFAKHLVDNEIENYKSLDSEQMILAIFDMDKEDFENILEEKYNLARKNSVEE